jgi:Ligand-gated ion channel
MSAFESTDDYLRVILADADIYGANVVPETSTRRNFPIDFTTRVLDASVILVARSTRNRSTNLYAYLDPFAPTLWACIVGVVFLHGVAFYLFERYASSSKTEQISTGRLNLFQSLIFGIMTFFDGDVDHCEVNSPSSGVLTLGYSIFVFIMIASYSANLANILIKAQQLNSPFQSIDDADAKSSLLCALTGPNTWCMDCTEGDATPIAVVQALYPRIEFHNVDSSDPIDLMKELNAGKCDGAILTVSQWESVKNRKIANPYCDIIQMGDSIMTLNAGW